MALFKKKTQEPDLKTVGKTETIPPMDDFDIDPERDEAESLGFEQRTESLIPSMDEMANKILEEDISSPPADYSEATENYEEEYLQSMEQKEGIVFSDIKDDQEKIKMLTDEETLYEYLKNKKAKELESKKKKTSSNNKSKNKSSGGQSKRSVQRAVPYRNVYENGLIEIEEGYFSKTYYLQDINFKVAPDELQEEIFLNYGDFLNSFDADTDISVTIYNRNLDEKKFSKNTLLTLESDGLNEYREEMNKILRGNMAKGKNNLVHEKYVSIGRKCRNIEDAISIFHRYDGIVNTQLKRITKKETIPLTLEERLRILYEIYHLDSDKPFIQKRQVQKKNGKIEELKNFNIAELSKMGISTKELVSPASIKFEKNHFEIGNYFGRSYFFSNVSSFMKADFLTEVSEMACNQLITIHYLPMRQDKAIRMVKNQNTNINGNIVAIEKKGGTINMELENAAENVRDLLSKITTENQKLIWTTMAITVFGETKEILDKNSSGIEQLFKNRMCDITVLQYQQEQGLNSSLPIGKNYLEIKTLNTTNSAAIYVPFAVQEWSDKKGIFYGMNAISNNMIIYNKKNGMNYNSLILGTPGAGKSFSAKREIISAVLGTTDTVYVIDPEREYVKLCQLFGGEIIEISPTSHYHINPFDLDIDTGEAFGEKDDPLTNKADFIISLCETVLSSDGTYVLSATEKSIIDRCVRKTYEPYLEKMKIKQKEYGITIDQSICPTLVDFYTTIKMQPEPEANDLALALEIYAVGSLNTFSYRTNINVSNRFVVYDIKDIGNGMMDFGLQVALDTIWNQMIDNRRNGKWTWMYIDEFHLLAKRKSSARYVQNIYKRARKWNGIPTGLTQQVEDLLQSPEVVSLVSTSAFVMMLNQAPLDKERLKEMFNLSEQEVTYITNADPGSGLIYNGKSVIPFVDKFPSDTKLYKAITTKGADDSDAIAAGQDADKIKLNITKDNKNLIDKFIRRKKFSSSQEKNNYINEILGKALVLLSEDNSGIIEADETERTAEENV